MTRKTGDDSMDDRHRLPRRAGLRAAAFAAIAAAIAAWNGFGARSGLARAQDGGPSGRSAGTTASPTQRAFLRQIHRSLKANDERLTALVTRLLEASDADPGPTPARDRAMNQHIMVKSMDASHTNAKLTSEFAEIDIKVYTEHVFIQDLATVDGEIKLAESDLLRARDILAFVQKDGDKLWANLDVRARTLTLELAESKKKTLLEYTKPRRIKELEARALGARIDAQAKKVLLEKELRELARLEAAAPPSGLFSGFLAARRPTADPLQPAFDLAWRAIEVERQLRARLRKLATENPPSEKIQKEIRDLANELGAIVDAAEAVDAANEFARMKPRIRDAARQAGVTGPK
jgi:hypothetical protein